MVRRLAFVLAAGVVCGVSGRASAQTPGPASLCTTTVQLPPPAARGGGPGAPQGRGGQQAQPAPPLPRLVKVKDDVYLIQNVNDVVAEIGPNGGNVTIYLTNDGVILFDSKNDRMHDDIVAKVRSLTDKPIKYVVLTHNHGDHSGGVAKMMEMGATAIISTEDREQLARGNQPVLPQLAYHGEAALYLGGKEVQLREFCGHTRGDTVAFLPGPRVLIVGDLVTTPDSIPQIVNYGDGGNWTDMGKTLDALAKIDFDVMVGGHGPLLTKAEFLKYHDKVAAIRERVRALNRKGRTQEEIAAAVLKEFNYTNAGQVGQMMRELK
jgi:glyoxylase-like metal-dependent hydrolase (beta-lactamase superfamily II)